MVVPFQNDDAAYLAWLESNPDGFVLNAERAPKASYLMLHRSTCRTISGTPARGTRWTGDYVKHCSEDPGELIDWARTSTGGTPTACLRCAPMA